MQCGRGMWRDDPIVRVFIFLFWLIGPPIVVGIVSLPIWAACNWVGKGISFSEIFGFLYIAGTLILAWISREDLVRILRNCWHPWEWLHHHPLIVFLGHLLQLVFVLVALATLAFVFTTAWNWVVIRLHLISFQSVLVVLLVIALPYLVFLGWIDLGVGLLWRRRYWREEKKRIAEARSRGECSKEEALEMAERGAELDTQEGLGEIKVVTDQEE